MGKRVQTIALKNLAAKTLNLGFVGENVHTQIVIDCSEVLWDYPDAVPSMVVQPPRGPLYPVTVTRDGDNIIWEITASDVVYSGSGQIQLTFTNSGEIVKSAVGMTRISGSIEATGPAPEPLQNWMDEAEETAARIADEAAEGAAEDVLGSVAPVYSAESTYAVGAYVFHDGKLYRCTTAIATAEEWNASHWTETALATEVADYAGTVTELAEDVGAIEDGLSDLESTVGTMPEGETVAGDLNALKTAVAQSSLVTTGHLNLVWEAGGINDSGAERNTAGNIRTKFIDAPSTPLTFTFSNSDFENPHVARLYIYTSASVFVEYRVYNTPGTYTVSDIPSGSKIRFRLYPSGASSEALTTADGPQMLTTSFDVYTDLSGYEDLSNIRQYPEAIWGYGYINQTSGAVNGRTSKTAIYAEFMQINSTKLVISVPTGYVGRCAIYSDANIDTLQSSVEISEGKNVITITKGYYIRPHVRIDSETEISLDVGDEVEIYYTVKTQDAIGNNQDRISYLERSGYSTMSIFETVGVLGDSFASGGTAGGYARSWPQIMARMFGLTATNYSKGGLSTKDWLENTTYGLTALLADDPLQLYMIDLGINDGHRIDDHLYEMGTIADIDTSDPTQNAGTFYGYYGKIVSAVLSHAPNAKVVLMSIPRRTERYFDAHIKEIAELFGLPFMDLTEDEYFNTEDYNTLSYGNSHQCAVGYGGMATAINRLMAVCMYRYIDYFRDFGTDGSDDDDD